MSKRGSPSCGPTSPLPLGVHLHDCPWCGEPYRCDFELRRRGSGLRCAGASNCSPQCADDSVRDSVRRLRKLRPRFGAACAALTAALVQAEEAIRSRHFVSPASVPLTATIRRGSKREREAPAGQLLWAEHDGAWRLLHVNARGVRPLVEARLHIRQAGALMLDELLYQLVLAEETA